MSSNGVESQFSGRRRGSHWVSRLLIFAVALILSIIIVLFFFTSGAR